MPYSNYPNGFANGVTIRGVPLVQMHPGKVWWVNNSGVLPEGGVGGSNGNNGSFLRPFATLDYAIGRCTASRGDIIAIMPGHAEDVAAAAGITVDIAGIAIVGLGIGSLQPQFHFTTAAGADIDITAANVSFYNIRFTAGVADMTPGALDISGANTTFTKCLFDEDGSGENYIIVADVADGTNGLWVEDCEYRGGDAANDHWFTLAGTHANVTFLNNRIYQETAQTAAAPLIEVVTDCNNLLLEGNKIYTATAAVAGAGVTITGTGNTGWAINNWVKSVDTDATAANATSAFDVTGLGSFENYFVADADAPAVVFGTAEDLT